MGGLPVLRWRNQNSFGIPMFHSFSEADRPNVEALCSHIAHYFEPVTLSAIVGDTKLPKNPITVTIDDGYRNFLRHGHPIFRRHRIPTTIYAVSGFADQRLWFWPDQVAFAMKKTGMHRSKYVLTQVEPEHGRQIRQRPFGFRQVMHPFEEQDGDQGCPNLDAQCIFAGADESLHFEVLLQRFEEEFDFPTIFIDGGYRRRAKLDQVGQKHDLSFVHRIPHCYAPQQRGAIGTFRFFAGRSDQLVRENIPVRRNGAFRHHASSPKPRTQEPENAEAVQFPRNSHVTTRVPQSRTREALSGSWQTRQSRG